MKMSSETLYRIFQIKSGKAMRVFIDPDDPKGIQGVQECIKSLEKGGARHGLPEADAPADGAGDAGRGTAGQ